MVKACIFRLFRCNYYWRRYRRKSNHSRRKPEDSSFAILIHSFDGYKRFWGPAAWFAERNLSSGYPIYFATEETPVSTDSFRIILTGKGSFLARLRRAILRLKRDGIRYVLYLQEDMWVSEPQSRGKLASLIEIMTDHQLDSLKLGKNAFWDFAIKNPEFFSIRKAIEPLSSASWPGEFDWFGRNRNSLSHHVTLFDIDFFLETIRVGLVCGATHQLDHEHLASAYLQDDLVCREGDRGKYRIAVWRNSPIIPYVHACEIGNLTEDGLQLLRENGIEDLYDPEISGEVFPLGRKE